MKYYMETYGCQMNVYDSGKLEDILREHCFSETSNPGDADFILVNTCSVRQHAEERALARIGELGRVRQRTKAVLAVCGCMAQRLGPEILRRRGVDIVIGPDAYSALLPAFEKSLATGSKTLDTTRDSGFRFEASSDGPARGLRAFVSIMKGCNNACSFCIVPAVRGPAVSRPHEEVLKEVRSLVDGGAKDVTLIGQNVNAYTHGRVDFAELLAMTSGAARDSRVRFTTSHPKDMSDSVIETMAREQNLCEHLHLPLQSGSSRILERMRRGYTATRYREIVKAVRRAVPDASITTDIIVGFPGEAVGDFEETCALVEEVGFDSAFMFKFSPRAGTEAASMNDDVPREEKERRLSELISIGQRVSRGKSASLIGRVMEVLVESEKSKGEERFLLGRTRCNRTVHVNGPREMVGRYMKARIDSSKGISLRGSLLDQ
ncbi:MAG: tRNA (N6-isopentenyl adenosine(37)-C2)-methylthiotransferase MiaB [Candidatus Eisenbacteria bacterium]|nr:tRNA (N6-isopentenyl adenosine(37)-C2)-methylthiotransferase MiaB [Candidatus Eisenbacteria bacterium]